ncbi:berberine bridge enzyme-like 8 [Salvia splendens]|uniref:berberine bridge enzyme-like 8 n=1 Tax=Salvia splendens TaxID=180675 RepID=UPI001C27C1FD|nr:berberine bridge enzyme-like 8 [Salvia splendens]
MMMKHGLTVENLADARIVDADGRTRDRKSMGEDLFWAIRGGGGASFGVVLSYKINLVTIPKTVTVFDIIKTVAENASGILHKWQKVAYKMDKELFIRVSLASLKETARAIFLTMYLGNCDKLVEIMAAQFPELGLQKHDCKEMSWIRAAGLGMGVKRLGFMGLSILGKILRDWSIQIDLTDQTAPTAWVQSGATLSELYYKIWETSKTLAFPAGVCPTLGIGGHISRGGYGNLLRKYCSSIDNVVDARVVDASRRILDREMMGEDLF